MSDSRFEVVNGDLKLKSGVSLDHEAEPQVTLTLTATDQDGLSTQHSVTFNVLDVNEAPYNLDLSATDITEFKSGAVIGTVSALDPDAGDSLTYSVSDARFEIVGGVLKLKDDETFNHETDPDAVVTITATDSHGLSVDRTFFLNVPDLNQAPYDLTLTGSDVSENASGAVVGTVSAIDPDHDSLTYTVSDSRFEIVGGQLKLVDGVSLDHEAEPQVTLTLTATDPYGLAVQHTVTIDVTNVNEAPHDMVITGSDVDRKRAGRGDRHGQHLGSRYRRYADLHRIRQPLRGRRRRA